MTGAWITDLFGAPDGGIGEYGKVILNDDANLTFFFEGNLADQANGEIFVSFGPTALEVWKGEFFVNNDIPGIHNWDNEFSVAGFSNVTAVPEPATITLMATALLGLLGASLRTRRRRRTA